MRWSAPAAALILIGLVYFMGIRSERTGFVDEVLDPNLKRIARPVLNAFSATPPKVPELSVGLEKEVLDSLQQLLTLPEENEIDGNNAHWLPVTLSLDDQWTEAMLSLRWDPERSDGKGRRSFRITLQHTDSMPLPRHFDLWPMIDAAPVSGRLFEQALAELGIPQPTRMLVEVKLDRRSEGPYILEAIPDSRMVAAWGYANAPLLRFDDELRVQAKDLSRNARYPVAPQLREAWLSAPIVAAYTPAVNTTEPRMTGAVRGLDALRLDHDGPAPLVHAENVGRFLALCDVLGAHESTTWWNLLFLWDSASTSFLVLPQQALAGTPIPTILLLHRTATSAAPPGAHDLAARLLSDPNVRSRYIHWLDVFSGELWLDSLLRRHAADVERYDRVVRGEFPDHRFEPEVLRHNIEVVRMMLRPKAPIMAYSRAMAGKGTVLSMANVHELPVVVHGMLLDGDTIPWAVPIILPPREPDKPLRYVRRDLEVPDPAPTGISLVTSVLGARHRQTTAVRPSALQSAAP